MAANRSSEVLHGAAGSQPGRLQDLVGYHLRRASVSDLHGAVAALEQVGLRTVPVSVLLTIVGEPGISSAEICRALSIQRANIVPILADLEKRGLFLREADPGDNRIQRLFATGRGKEEAARALSLLVAHEERLLSRLDAGERDCLRSLLAKVWQQGRANGISAPATQG